MRLPLTILFFSLATASHAACPPLPDRTSERAQLLTALSTADTYNAGRAAIEAMWLYWRTAPDEAAQEMLVTGIEAIRYGDYLKADAVLGRLVAYCPDYAEGYNQAAFAAFLKEEDDKALALLEQAIALEPAHFGALAGIGLVHLRAGNKQLAMRYLAQAVEINPWLNERGLLNQLRQEGDKL